MKITMGGRSKGKCAYYKELERKSITELWRDGWSIRNISLKHRVSIPYACQELGFGVRGVK